LVQEAGNGFTFDPCNIEELAGLMAKISAFNFPLSEFGAASREIISHWGPERFASGLHQAVKVAISQPAARVSLFGPILLKAVMMRQDS